MPDDNLVTLSQMKPGESGTVVDITSRHGKAHGTAHGLAQRLNTLGIIPGKEITKVNSMLGHGPVTIEIDRAKVALGFGMARHILIRLSDRNRE